MSFFVNNIIHPSESIKPPLPADQSTAQTPQICLTLLNSIAPAEKTTSISLEARTVTHISLNANRTQSQRLDSDDSLDPLEEDSSYPRAAALPFGYGYAAYLDRLIYGRHAGVAAAAPADGDEEDDAIGPPPAAADLGNYAAYLDDLVYR